MLPALGPIYISCRRRPSSAFESISKAEADPRHAPRWTLVTGAAPTMIGSRLTCAESVDFAVCRAEENSEYLPLPSLPTCLGSNCLPT